MDLAGKLRNLGGAIVKQTAKSTRAVFVHPDGPSVTVKASAVDGRAHLQRRCGDALLFALVCREFEERGDGFYRGQLIPPVSVFEYWDLKDIESFAVNHDAVTLRLRRGLVSSNEFKNHIAEIPRQFAVRRLPPTLQSCEVIDSLIVEGFAYWTDRAAEDAERALV